MVCTFQVNISASSREGIAKQLKKTFPNFQDFKPRQYPSRHSLANVLSGASRNTENGATTLKAEDRNEIIQANGGDGPNRPHSPRRAKLTPFGKHQVDLNNRVPKDLFEDAKQHAFNLMTRDCYARFKAIERERANSIG